MSATSLQRGLTTKAAAPAALPQGLFVDGFGKMVSTKRQLKRAFLQEAATQIAIS
jgi:hypothetical protein